MSERTRSRLLRAPRRIRAYLAARRGEKVLFIASSEEAAERYARDASCFSEGAVVHLPSRGVAYGDVFDPPAELVSARQRALHSLDEAALVVAGPLAYMERTPLYDPVRLFEGAQGSPDEVLERLTGMGYERVDRVLRPGELAVRGGIVDVFPGTRRSPVRVEWWGDEVESVRAFSLATQRVVRDLEEVAIFAVWEGDLAGLAREAGEELPEEALRGVRVAGMDRLLDRLNPVGARELIGEAEVWTEEAEESLPEEIEGFAGELYDRRLPQASVEFTGSEDGEPVSVSPTLMHRTNLREAARRMDGLVEEGMAVFVACGSRNELRRIIYAFGEIDRVAREAEVAEPGVEPGLYAIPQGITEGFVYPAGGIAVFSLEEIFGRRRGRGARRRSGVNRSFADFRSGDLVVHDVHGVGRFEGLVAREVLGTTRDYMHVSYRDGDSLYVPYEQMELLNRYIGGEEVRLDRLGGASWAKVTDRVRRRVKALAGELLSLHAERENSSGYAFPADGEWERELEESFPFRETPDQEAAIAAVKEDMRNERPMDRLVCGDVGFGKTEVAVRAAFKAALAGKQTMMLAPTTILVEQHYQTFVRRLAGFAVRVERLSRFVTASERRRVLREFAAGEIDVLIGTHALLGAEVRPKDLGLLVVDEEQRFGVKHKERLKELRASVDVLTLTATPIPRTMQMGLSSLREISIIETPPEGRRSILTHVGPYEEHIARRAIERELQRGGQTFFVHNRVEDIDDVADHVRSLVPGARVGVAHGQMGERELEKVMASFLEGEADILVTTTIVESGIDVSTANTLIVDRADAMGLAQLYQLRGRIGRSRVQAYCYLFAPLGATEEAQRRLEALMDFTELGSGFAIAMRDLEIRGAGNLLGAEQSGHIAAVGFEMYMRLLQEAVAAARGEGRREEGPAPVVELPLDAYIPPEYVGDEIERVDLYRRASGVRSVEEADELAAELEDRFGEIPEEAANLLGLSAIKLLARQAGATSVSHRSGTLTVYGVSVKATVAASIRRATGGMLNTREGRLTVRGSSLGPLELAEAVLGELAGRRAIIARKS